MSETALAIAKDYPTEKFNLLIPVKTMQELSPLHKIVINEVQISHIEADKDVYKEKNGELALTKRSLMKLMAAANIQVIDSRSVPTQKCNKCYQMAQATKMAPKCFECPYQDDVAYQVTIAVPEPSGLYRTIKATKEIRLADAKASMSDAQFKQFKPFRTEQCESKALNRALREGLMLKSSYKADELKKPFAVALVMPNMDDPDLKKAMVESYANNAASLYGGQAAQLPGGQMQSLPQASMTVIPPDDDYDNVDMQTGEVTPPSAEVIDVDVTTDPEPIGCEECASMIEPFTDGKGKVWEVSDIITHTQEKYGKKLCKDCLLKAQKAAKEAEKAKKEGK